MPDVPTASPEFSRPIDIARIGSSEVVHDISADAGERAALAQRFGLLGMDRLEGRVRLRRTHGGTMVRLAAHFTAEVTQACVVSLEPVHNHVEDDFVILFGDAQPGQDVTVDPESEGDIEPFPDGPLDIGEAVAQELSLALDPYPHAPGAQVEAAAPPDDAPEAPEPRVNPFAALEKLKKPKR
jgi:uncharacterized metal-binding protein YceD (DUF177 family)